MNNYEIKKQRRIDRLNRCAELYKKQAEQLHANARKDAEMIPFGQPILVGHHSERRDRNYRARIMRRFEKSFELSDKAEYYTRRAASAQANRSRSSDDPEAVFKLEEKVRGLEKLQETMKAINKIIRKYDVKDDAQRKMCFDEIMKTGLLKQESTAWKLLTPDCFGGYGFAKFNLTNNNATIRTAKKRIEELKAKRSQETKETTKGDIRIVENVEENRLQLFFPGKPADEMRAKLKSWGFRWSPFNGCWQAFLNNRAKYAVNQLI